jgi:glycosyltransferase involved in cell wall biosynthesis
MPQEEIQDGGYFPQWRPLVLRGALRLAGPFIQHEYETAILTKVRASHCPIFIAYKGTFVTSRLIEELKDLGCKTVNVYPDCSPLAQGQSLRDALGHYDLVVSTKVWHPQVWGPLFGYGNRCRFVPQGYDPGLHYRPIGEEGREFDIGMVATYRPEYGRMVLSLAKEPELARRRVVIFGNGWEVLRRQLPPSWVLPGPAQGHAYMQALSLAKVYVAPLTREVVVDGKSFPGDEDSTRTYELPAAGCFYVHRRTDYVKTLFEEDREVLYFDDADELAEQLKRALGDAPLRKRLRESAQPRAVPRDSLDNRATDFIRILEEEGLLEGRESA